MMPLNRQDGFTLIEVVVTIVLLGIVATIAFKQIGSTVETAKVEHTKSELAQLAHAISGSPESFADGHRIDFGYYGDIGAMPPSLAALAINPGLATWNGPYVSTGTENNGYLHDAWGTVYSLTGTTVRSTGSGSAIDYSFAANASDLSDNTVSGYIVDAGNQPPGPIYKDSLLVYLTYPDGSGGYATSAYIPSRNGQFVFNSVPIGAHTLGVIYLPHADTTKFTVAVAPNQDIKLDIVLPTDI